MAMYRPDPLFFPEELHVVQHPQKTFIGRFAQGFDFLGDWFSPMGLAIARQTMQRWAGEGVPV